MQYDEIFERITAQLSRRPPPLIVVAAPYSPEVLTSLQTAVTKGYIQQVLLVGDKTLMPAAAADFVVEHKTDPTEIASFAAETAKQKKGVLIKGTIASSVILKAALSGAASSGKKPIASHVYVMQSKAFPNQTVLVADAGVNIKPDCATKAAIIQNTVSVAHKLGIARPKVALICAVETVNQNIPSTLDAVELTAMGGRGEFGEADIGGPMAMDAAMLPSAAKTKNLTGPVAGNANVLVLNDIDAANSTAKAMIGVDGKAMGVVVGGVIPVAFPSRGDSEQTRYHSLLLAAYLAQVSGQE